MWVRLTACLVWAILAMSAVYWSFKLLVRPSGMPPHALLVATDQAARGDPLRLFAAPAQLAAAPIAPQASSRFRLLGVMAPKVAAAEGAPAHGLALIAVDGKPARAFPVGAHVDGEWVLQSVSARTASIGPEGGAVVAQLEVPALPGPAMGSLPSLPADAVVPAHVLQPAAPPPAPLVAPQRRPPGSQKDGGPPSPTLR
jgi:general secretion pathway protein C